MSNPPPPPSISAFPVACPICLCAYSFTNHIYQPRVLYCGHSICHTCLYQIWKHSGKIFQCYFKCQGIYQNVKSIPLNYLCMEMLAANSPPTSSSTTSKLQELDKSQPTSILTETPHSTKVPETQEEYEKFTNGLPNDCSYCFAKSDCIIIYGNLSIPKCGNCQNVEMNENGKIYKKFPNLLYNSIAGEMATKERSQITQSLCCVCKLDRDQTCLYKYCIMYALDECQTRNRQNSFDIQVCIDCANKYKYNTKY
jgi:hypothetical protein